MLEVLLPTREQLWGMSALQVIKDYGIQTEISDFAICLGAAIVEDVWNNHQRPLGMITTSSCDDEGYLILASERGTELYSHNLSDKYYTMRPVLPADVVCKLAHGPIEDMTLAGDKQVKITTYGSYPQSVDMEKTKEYWQNHNIKGKNTGKKYTIANFQDNQIRYSYLKEFQIGDDKYVCVPASRYNEYNYQDQLIVFEAGKEYLFKVDPLKWLVDPSGLFVCKDGILSGIPFDQKDFYQGDYENTFSYYYNKQFLSHEILSNEEYANTRHWHKIIGYKLKTPRTGMYWEHMR